MAGQERELLLLKINILAGGSPIHILVGKTQKLSRLVPDRSATDLGTDKTATSILRLALKMTAVPTGTSFSNTLIFIGSM